VPPYTSLTVVCPGSLLNIPIDPFENDGSVYSPASTGGSPDLETSRRRRVYQMKCRFRLNPIIDFPSEQVERSTTGDATHCHHFPSFHQAHTQAFQQSSTMQLDCLLLMSIASTAALASSQSASSNASAARTFAPSNSSRAGHTEDMV
jgi:hypothetical protein